MKEYIISYTEKAKSTLQEQLAQYNPHYFKHALYCAVQVKPEYEKSLLGVLARMPEVTYREASTYKTQKKEK